MIRQLLLSCCILACGSLGLAQTPATATVTSSASFSRDVAPSSLVTIFTNPSIHRSANSTTTKVKVKDRRGNTHHVEVFYSTPQQTNIYVQDDIATGPCEFELSSGINEVSRGAFPLTWVAPGLFAANANGVGVPAAVVLRVTASGVQTYERLFQWSVQLNRYVPLAIDKGAPTDKVFLILFGTGFRNNPDMAEVQVTLGEQNVQVYYAGSQGPAGIPGTFLGLDQINVLIPNNVAPGVYSVVAKVGMLATNALTVEVK